MSVHAPHPDRRESLRDQPGNAVVDPDDPLAGLTKPEREKAIKANYRNRCTYCDRKEAPDKLILVDLDVQGAGMPSGQWDQVPAHAACAERRRLDRLRRSAAPLRRY